MEIGITIFFLVAILFLIIGFIVSDDNDTTPLLCGAFGGMCFVAAIALLIDSQNNNTSSPSALDVYRGKTNLVVTYSDSVATDSVVVFKK